MLDEESKNRPLAFTDKSVHLRDLNNLFVKFTDQFYPDVTTCKTSSGEKTYYDVAYGKDAQDHVLGLLSTGPSAEEYYLLEN